MTNTNATHNLVSKVSFGIDPTYFASYCSSTSTYEASGLTPLSKTDNWYNFIGAGPGSYYPVLMNCNEQNLLTGGFTTTQNHYDAWANLDQSDVNINNEENRSSYAHFIAAGSSVPSKPQYAGVNITRAGQPMVGTMTTYQYDSYGRPDAVTKDYNLPVSTAKTCTYDVFGNVLTTTIYGTNISLSPVTTYTYDPKGRFPVSVANALNQVATTDYDYRWGKPVKVTGIDGLTDQYAYDSWGQLSSASSALGYTIKYATGWDLANGAVWYSLVAHPGAPDEKIWYNSLGRELKMQKENYGGSWTTAATTYDARGNVESTTRPYIAGAESPIITTNSYDNLNRLTTVSDPTGTASYRYAYSAGQTTTTITDPGGHPSTKTAETSGKILRSSDAGGAMTFTYDSWGNVLEAAHGYFSDQLYTYNQNGQRTSMWDADAGTTTYSYDAFNRLTDQTDALGNTKTVRYDILNRVVERTGPEGVTKYTYYGAGSGLSNQLQHVYGFNGVDDDYAYDQYGRLSQQTKQINGQNFTTTFVYDPYGRLNATTYPSGVLVANRYDANGFLAQVESGLSNGSNAQLQSIWRTHHINGLGKYDDYELGNGQTTKVSYLYGMPLRYYTPGIQDLDLDWDFANGNLRSRTDDLLHNTETFRYDNLNRLVYSGVCVNVPGADGPFHDGNGNGGSNSGTCYTPVTLTYDQTMISYGNIKTKTDVGSYEYGAVKPHAVKTVTNSSNAISTLQQDIFQTPFNKVREVKENGYAEDFTYDAAYDRVTSILTLNGAPQFTRYYLGDCEITLDANNDPSYVTYIHGGDGICALAVGKPNGEYAYNYVYKDHLGSFLTVTNGAAGIVAEQNFDAWGRNRDPHSWACLSSPYGGNGGVPDWLYRGFTGHEHLPQFDLINMNARLYDPILGRMCRPDNYVQSPLGTQNYNRYSYCLNNPLRYTDPSGNYCLWDDAIVFGVGFIVGDVGYTLCITNGKASVGDFFTKKALTAGLAGGVIAEGCYLTAGGMAAGAGSFTAAQSIAYGLQFASSYSLSAISMYWGAHDQIHDAKGWDGVWLCAGYDLVAGISTGMSSDLSLSAKETGSGVKETFSLGAKLGKFGEFVSGGTSSLGSGFLSKYNAGRRSFDSYKFGEMAIDFLSGATSEAFNKAASDMVGGLMPSSLISKRGFWGQTGYYGWRVMQHAAGSVVGQLVESAHSLEFTSGEALIDGHNFFSEGTLDFLNDRGFLTKP